MDIQDQEKLKEVDSSKNIHSLEDLAVYYRLLVALRKFSEARTLILAYFFRKIALYNDWNKAVKVYNKIANNWNVKHKLLLPENFVYDAFNRRNIDNGN